MRLVIYGHSDDCIEVDGDFSEEFYGGGDAEHLDDEGDRLIIEGPDGQQMWVYAYFVAGWTWRISAPYDDGDDEITLPSWPVQISPAHAADEWQAGGYTTVVIIDAPDGSTVRWGQP